MVQAANIGFRGQPVQGILFKVSGFRFAGWNWFISDFGFLIFG